MSEYKSMLTPQQALQHYFGFDQFRAGQKEVIQQILNKQNCLLVMPTGSGKSLAYQLPGMMLDGLTLVISPLIALMKDQVDSLVERGIRATFINSSLPSSEGQVRMRAVLEGAVKLLYVAPERLRNHQFTSALSNMKISLLAVDEAHCLSQWGHDFRPDYLQIGPTWQAIGRPPLLATTATATPLVQKDIATLLGLKDMHTIVTGFNRPNLTFRVNNMPNDKAKLEAVQVLLKNLNESAIIYAATRRKTEELAGLIRTSLKIPTLAYHGGLERLTREQIQNDFMADRAKVIVATNAFGMGVDKANVRLVIHYNMPGTVEAYYQEAGRAGRDRQPAQCILLFAPDDQGLQEWMINSDTPSYEDLFQIYTLLQQSAQDQVIYITPQELAHCTNLHPVKVRVTLNELEQAGLIFHLGSQGAYNQWKVLSFSQQSLENQAERIQKRTKIRLALLNDMLQYIYLTTCRRQFMLSYFGDQTPPRSPRCCDNHHQDDVEALPKARTPQEWYPLIILETARGLSPKAGRHHLVSVLAGSQAQKVKRLKHDQHKFYGKLAHLKRNQIMALIDALIEARFLQLPLTQGRPRQYAVVDITDLGQKALKTRASLPLKLNHLPDHNPQQQIQAPHSHTIVQTYQLFEQGHTPSEIAAQRNLTERTIYRHLAQLIAAERIALHQVIPAELEAQILQAIEQVGTTDRLTPIKAILPRSITFDHIKCVLAASVDWTPTPSVPEESETRDQPDKVVEEQEDTVNTLESNDVILMAVAKLGGTLGRTGLVKFLTGSQASWLTAYCSHSSYGQLAHLSNKAVLDIIDALLVDNRLVSTGGNRPKVILPDINSTTITNAEGITNSVYEERAKSNEISEVSTIPQTDVTSSAREDILTLVHDLEGLLTPQTLAKFLTASMEEVVSFSDHELHSKLNGKMSVLEVEEKIEGLVAEGRVGVKRGRLYIK